MCAEVSGDLHGHSLGGADEIHDRRRPHVRGRAIRGGREDGRNDAETGGWRASLREARSSPSAPSSERHAAETSDGSRSIRRASSRELDDAKRRKTAVVAAAEDPFALFD